MAEVLSTELWEAGTAGIFEEDREGDIILLAGFETNAERLQLLSQFSQYAPEWRQEQETDWVSQTENAWPPREIGERLFLAPMWSFVPTPWGRERIVHNPGLACGTGEHPCTQLALVALEKCVVRDCTVLDIGTGSGILSLAACKLGASICVGIDPDEEALRTAAENFALNDFEPRLAVGFIDCLADECADVTVANISGTVLLSILDDLLRITRPGGWLILTGFPVSEAVVLQRALPGADAFENAGWQCLMFRTS